MKFKTLRLFALLFFTHQLQAMNTQEDEDEYWISHKPIIDNAVNNMFRVLFDISEKLTTSYGYPRENESISVQFQNYKTLLSRENASHIILSLLSSDGKKILFTDRGNGTWIIPPQPPSTTSSHTLSKINELQLALTAALEHSETEDKEIRCRSFYKDKILYTIRRTSFNTIILERST